MTDPLILALETSGEPVSLAVFRLDRGLPVLAAQVSVSGRSESRRLLALLDDVLRKLDSGPDGLGAVLVGLGPGTFTGVRVGVSTARVLSLALGIPVLGVSSLSSLAAEAILASESGGGNPPLLVVPVTDARRGQVFGAVYRRVAGTGGNQQYVWTRESAIMAYSPRDLASEVERRVAEWGPSAEGGTAAEDCLVVGHVQELKEHLGAGVLAENRAPRASGLLVGQSSLREPGGGSAGDRLMDALGAPKTEMPAPPGEIGSPEAVVPIYVRFPDADSHIKKMRDPWTR